MSMQLKPVSKSATNIFSTKNNLNDDLLDKLLKFTSPSKKKKLPDKKYKIVCSKIWMSYCLKNHDSITMTHTYLL